MDRRGIDRLAAWLSRTLDAGRGVLELAPYSGHVFVFRGKRGDLIKLLWFDGDGLCLFQKRLVRGHFVWPQATSGPVSLTRAQLSMLLEGIDWRQPQRTWEPQSAG
jgi:transposase